MFKENKSSTELIISVNMKKKLKKNPEITEALRKAHSTIKLASSQIEDIYLHYLLK